MPTPAKTSRSELIAIARRLVDTCGADAVTVSAVASAAGVKAPSIYKHFVDRAALLKAVELEVLHDLETTLRREIKGRTARARLGSMAETYRAFALAAPRRYAMIYGEHALEDPEIAAACLSAAGPLFDELRAAGVPEGDVLPISRTITAWLHGFCTMEIARAFRLGGSIDDAFETGLSLILGEATRVRG